MSDQPKKPTYSYDLTQPVILSHPTLITPKPFMENGKPKGDPVYSASFIFDPANPEFAALRALAARAVKETCPGQRLDNFIYPFKDGTKVADARAEKCRASNKEPDGEFQRGKLVLKTKSKYPPSLAGILNGKIVDFTTDEAKAANEKLFYFGVECLATISFVAYAPIGEAKGNVSAYLNCVLSLNKGKKLSSSAPSAAERFKGYVGHLSAEDPTTGLDNTWDDEIPL